MATAGDDIADLRLRNDRIRAWKPTWPPPAACPRWWPTSWPAPETAARAKLADLRSALDADLPAMREVLQALFPEGVTFRPAENAARRVWAISGTADSTVSN